MRHTVAQCIVLTSCVVILAGVWVSPLEYYPCQASIASDPDINHVFKAAVIFLQDLVYKLPPPRVECNEAHNSTHYYPPVITSGLGLWTR